MEKVEKNEAQDQEAVRRSMQITIAKERINQIDILMSRKLKEIRDFLSHLQNLDSSADEEWCSYRDFISKEITVLFDKKMLEIDSILRSPKIEIYVGNVEFRRLYCNLLEIMNFIVPERLLDEVISVKDTNRYKNEMLKYEFREEIPF